MSHHMFVYQEWDIMRERAQTDDRLEKVTPVTPRVSSFAVQMQEARISQRMTIADLAQKCGITPRSISLIENGSETPSPSVYATLVQLLNLSK